jgi:hypothetical protein
MALYLISYDLIGKKTIEEYETLIVELQRLGAKKVLYSEWVWKSNNSSDEIREHLRQFMHANDRILVSEITSNWASNNAMININNL